MKLSTRGRYGLKAMFQLALHYGEGPIPLKNIADKQELSENYLEQLVSQLRKEGLLESVRGSQGGYMLAKPPQEITVGDVLRVLEGNLALTDCVLDNDLYKCDREDECVAKLVWLKISNSINEVTDTITLNDMVEEHRKILAEKN